VTGEQKSKTGRALWPLVVAGVLVTLVLMGSTAVGYWRYAMSVPPLPPSLPPVTGPNGYADAVRLVRPLVRTNTRFWRWGLVASGREVPLPLPALERRLHSLQPLLDRLRATLRKEWKPIRPANAMLTSAGPYSVEFQSCAVALAGECRVRRAHGDSAGAMRYALDTMELAGKLASCGGTDYRMAGDAIHDVGLWQAEQTAWLLPRAAAVEALARTRKLRREWPPLSATLEIDRQETATALHALFVDLNRVPLKQRPKWLDDNLDDGDEEIPWSEKLRLLIYPRHLVLTNADYFFQAQIAELRKPPQQRSPVPLPNDGWGIRVGLARDSWVSHETWRGETLLWRGERMDTDLALLEVALAVRLQYLNQGIYPKSLTELPRQLLPEVPLDLWQRPLTYRLKDGRPLLYSLGPDGIDQGGRPMDTKLSYMTAPASSPGDRVFGQLAAPIMSRVPLTKLFRGPL
jgi:hypothetical protein